MKNLLKQFKMSFIFLVDLLVAFGSLFWMVLIRYGGKDINTEFQAHLVPFSIVIVLFIVVFYIFNLYSFRFNKNITEFTNSFLKSLIIAFVISVLIFYVFGEFFQLTPKTNLVLFTVIFGIVDFYLRILIKRFFTKHRINRKIIIVSDEKNILVDELDQNQNIGYEILSKTNVFDLDTIIKLNPDLVVVNYITEKEFEKIYTLIKKGISVYTINSFYEEIFQKVPTEKLEKEEIVDYLSKNRAIFNVTKRALDVCFAIFLLIIFSPFFILIPILIKLTSKGPVFFKHQRISLNDTEFTIYKFRSMYTDAEKNGAVWTTNNKDNSRITLIGRLMRETHIDEIPQLINILKGDISFVGPRPERPEFTDMLKKDILYYDLRHSVKAGLTGWAQVNYKYGSSVEDAREKLRYDFYYIKNRNIFFDFLIILKTVAKVFLQ